MTRVNLTFLVALSILCAAADATETQRIEAALNSIEQSKLTFVRNGAEHDGKSAADHLRAKLKRAGDEVKTFDDFVEKIASKSSMSGKPYQVKLDDGTVVELATWIRAQDASRK